MGELIGELNIVWKTSGTSTAFKQTLFFYFISLFMACNFPWYKVDYHIIGDEALG